MPIAAEDSDAADFSRSFKLIQLKLIAMNWDRIEGNWKQLKGKLREQWGRLTDDEIDLIAGRRDKLAGCLQNSYGIAKDEAEKQIDAFAAEAERNRWVQ